MGIPTVVLATDLFADLAAESAAQSGLRGARIVAVPHPIGGVAFESLDRRADAAVEEVMGRLLGRQGSV